MKCGRIPIKLQGWGHQYVGCKQRKGRTRSPLYAWSRAGRGARAAMESCRGFGQLDVAGEEQKSRLGKKVSYY